ncbi:MAG: hypothetical protein ABIZ34_01670 [Candidatus Limnocylindrales bacterium]
MTRRAAIGMAALLVSTATIGCSGGGATRVEGLVITVVGDSPVSVDSFTLRSSDGKTYEFRFDPSVDFTQSDFPPNHLREHQAVATPVRVTYRTEGSGTSATYFATRLEDADE